MTIKNEISANVTTGIFYGSLFYFNIKNSDNKKDLKLVAITFEERYNDQSKLIFLNNDNNNNNDSKFNKNDNEWEILQPLHKWALPGDIRHNGFGFVSWVYFFLFFLSFFDFFFVFVSFLEPKKQKKQKKQITHRSVNGQMQH